MKFYDRSNSGGRWALWPFNNSNWENTFEEFSEGFVLLRCRKPISSFFYERDWKGVSRCFWDLQKTFANWMKAEEKNYKAIEQKIIPIASGKKRRSAQPRQWKELIFTSLWCILIFLVRDHNFLKLLPTFKGRCSDVSATTVGFVGSSFINIRSKISAKPQVAHRLRPAKYLGAHRKPGQAEDGLKRRSIKWSVFGDSHVSDGNWQETIIGWLPNPFYF